MSALTDFLYDRLNQLQARIKTIQLYAKQKGILSGKGFRTEDIPKIEQQIEETEWAIAGINEWNKQKKKVTKTSKKYSGKHAKNIPS